MPEPYYDDGQVQLWHGDCREILPALDVGHAGVVVADPPYGETSLGWDRWPAGWVAAVSDAVCTSCSMWCFGSLRMFLRHAAEFADWQLAQDIVWEKQNGSGFATDRFKRVHEVLAHWYRGPWTDLHCQVPRVAHPGARKGHVIPKTNNRAEHTGVIGAQAYVDDGLRMMRSVVKVRNMHGRGAIHPTQKPLGIIDPLLRYSLAPGGTVLDPFAGSCSTLVAAREAGYRAIGIEADEAMCAKAVGHRLAQGALQLGGAP